MELFNGEKFINKKSEIEKAQNDNDDKINKKYDSGEVRIVTEQARYPLPTLKDMFSDNKYNLHPDFQRRRRWSQEKKSKLIESFIINVPVPPVFLYEIDYANFEVMDGLQRITTIIDFYKDLYVLEGLEEWKELNGKKYSELPIRIKEGIDRRYLSSIILLKESAKDDVEADRLKKIVFERLNSGGVKLTAQETRNALYDGKLNKLCLKLSENSKFKRMWNISDDVIEENTDEDYYEIDNNKLYRDMSDVELVLRFFAFRHINQYTGRLDSFLDNFLKTGNSFSEEVLNNYKNLFNKNIDLADKLFGEYAFRQYKKIRSKDKWSEPTRTAYDPMMLALIDYTESDFDFDKKTQEDRIELLSKLYEENVNKFDGKRQSKSEINERMEILKGFLNDLKKGE
ncbi:MAG: DUF262 domain-containing protein [Clostridia bacterium]|nr:DUF262 domain-containing protein [Clostridia bacterium]